MKYLIKKDDCVIGQSFKTRVRVNWGMYNQLKTQVHVKLLAIYNQMFMLFDSQLHIKLIKKTKQ